MSWGNVEVIGLPNREAVEYSSRIPDSIVLELDGDILAPHTYQSHGTWFVELNITGIDTIPDTDVVDRPDEPMTSVCYTGTITGTDTPILLIFFGEVLDRFLVWLD